MPRKFSEQLEGWLKSRGAKTLAGLDEVFGAKSFAIIILLLMVVPALPIPTGVVTHLFEIIAMLLALEMTFGFKRLWLPKRIGRVQLSRAVTGRAIPRILRLVSWVEARSYLKWKAAFKNPALARINGVVLFVLALTAFLAPPFSGLDTLPSMGAVLVCLSIILEDALVLLTGYIVGAAGALVVVVLGALTVNWFMHLF